MNHSEPLPRLRATTIFFDMDDTITTTVATPNGETFLSTLVRVVAQAHHCDEPSAAALVRATFDPETESIEPYYAALGITARQLWDALMQWLPRQVNGFPDAIETIRTLHARGFRLFPGTTNSGLICRAKLAIAGIGSDAGSPYFVKLLGGAEVHPRGKTTPEFFVNLLRLAGAKPETVVHVGDSATADLALARQAGITQVVLPRRDQARDWLRQDDGGIYVKSLALLPRMLTPPTPAVP